MRKFASYSYLHNKIFIFVLFRSNHQRCVVAKSVLRNFTKFTGKHLRQGLIFNKVADWACNVIKKETLAQVFSCEFCEISKNTFFTDHVRATASVFSTLFFNALILLFSFVVFIWMWFSNVIYWFLLNVQKVIIALQISAMLKKCTLVQFLFLYQLFLTECLIFCRKIYTLFYINYMN